MFKATEVERKIRDITLLIDMQINLSSWRTSEHYFSLSIQQLSWDWLGTKNVSSMLAQNVCKINKSWQQMRQKSHPAYPPEIIQTSSLSKMQKKSLEHNDCLHVVSVSQQRVRKPPTDNIPSPQNYFQTNCQQWNNTGTICLNVTLQTWDMFLHTGLIKLHIFFVIRRCTLKELRSNLQLC